MDMLTAIICGLFFVLLVIFVHLTLLFLVQWAFVALLVGVGGIFSSCVRENRGRVRDLLETAIKYRLFSVPGVIVFDLLANSLLADSSVLDTWIMDDLVRWVGLGLLLLASVGLAVLISFWGKTKQLAAPHRRVLVMESILSCYLCWIGTKVLIGD